MGVAFTPWCAHILCGHTPVPHPSWVAQRASALQGGAPYDTDTLTCVCIWMQWIRMDALNARPAPCPTLLQECTCVGCKGVAHTRVPPLPPGKGTRRQARGCATHVWGRRAHPSDGVYLTTPGPDCTHAGARPTTTHTHTRDAPHTTRTPTRMYHTTRNPHPLGDMRKH